MNDSAAPIPPPASLELRDFSDRLPAVLVKELRQGLRARLFVIPFLILHGVLVLSTLAAGSGGTAFFWQSLTIMLAALLPMRNIGALAEERQANTLDTLMLTRLTPWRIVWGKWSATFALVLLTAVSALPYLLVRYLNGGSSFVQEGLVLAGLVMVSGALTAVLTALSTLSAGVARHILGVLLILMVNQLASGQILMMLSFDRAPGMMVAMLVVVALWAALFSLWHAAAAIAPAALNLTTPRRLTSLAAITAGIGLAIFADWRDDFIFGSVILMLTATSVVEMGEQGEFHPGVATSFARRGAIGKLAALFLHPGWSTGVMFCAPLWVIVALTCTQEESLVARMAALCFFPICAGAPLIARAKGSGVVLMVLLALLAQLIAFIAGWMLPDEMDPFLSVIPTLESPFESYAAIFWTILAIAIAARPLFMLIRRISRESNL